jgi:hypothetical protein
VKAGGGHEEKGEVGEESLDKGTEALSKEGEAANQEGSSLGGYKTIVLENSADEPGVVTPALDMALHAPPSVDKEDSIREQVPSDRGLVHAASATSTLKSLSAPLPESPNSRPVTSLPSSLEELPSAYANSTRPRQASLVSASSVYSPSVYTTNSGVNGPTAGAVDDASADSKQHHERHGREVVKFYVGRETWEELGYNWCKSERTCAGRVWVECGIEDGLVCLFSSPLGHGHFVFDILFIILTFCHSPSFRILSIDRSEILSTH